MKILKYLMIGLVMFVASCSSDNDDDIIANKYPRKVSIELKVYSPKNEDLTIGVLYMRGKASNNNEDAFEGLPKENLTFEDVKLPFSKKIERTVDFKDRVFFNIGIVEKEENDKDDDTIGIKQISAELLIDGKVVRKFDWASFIDYTFE